LKSKRCILRGVLFCQRIGGKLKLEKAESFTSSREKGYLKLVPKRRVDLTACFDKVDLGVESIGSWKEFEKKLYGESK